MPKEPGLRGFADLFGSSGWPGGLAHVLVCYHYLASLTQFMFDDTLRPAWL